MRPVLVVLALRRPALWAALMSTVGCGGNGFLVGDPSEGGTSGTATSGTAVGSSGQTASAGTAATGSTKSGSGSSATGESGSASGATSGASSGAGDGGPQAKTCKTTSDCPTVATSLPSSVTCEYAIDGGCSSVGTCVTTFDTGPGPVCSTLYYGCGCDGTDVYLGCNTSSALMATKPISRLGRCESDGGVGEASVSPESGRDACMLEATDYGQACAVDTDCTPIFQGDVCTQGCRCPNAAISSTSFAQYKSDLSNAEKIGASDASNVITTCECPAYLGPCCRNRLCQVGSACK
jgi:hypothetical protein